MSVITIEQLKSKFEGGDHPGSADYINLIDTLAALPALTDSVSSTSTTTAATANAVKIAYDVAQSPTWTFISGYYYKGVSAQPVFTTPAPLAANNTYYLPFVVTATTTFDRIMIRTGIGFVGTSSVRLGIYNSSGGKPTTVLLDAGTVSCTSAAGTFQITISQQLSAGFYFLANNPQSVATTNNYTGTPRTQASAFNGTPYTSGGEALQFFSQSGVTGAFGTAENLSDGFNAGAPYVFLRAV
jgi:hypothetical protein